MTTKQALTQGDRLQAVRYRGGISRCRKHVHEAFFSHLPRERREREIRECRECAATTKRVIRNRKILGMEKL